MKKILLIFLLLSSFAGYSQLQLPYSVKLVNPLPVDAYYYNAAGTPYTNTAQVISQVLAAVRYRGMTVNVAGAEYWFAGGTADSDLILKSVSSSVSVRTISGSNTYTVTGTETSYVDGFTFYGYFTYPSSTSPVTMNVNSLGAKNIITKGRYAGPNDLQIGGYLYMFVYSSNYNSFFAEASNPTKSIIINTSTTYNVDNADLGGDRVIQMYNVSPNTVTVSNSFAHVPGSTIDILQEGPGLTTVVQGSGATIISDNGSLASNGQNQWMTLYYTQTAGTWNLYHHGGSGGGGSEVTSNKVTDFSTFNSTLYPATSALLNDRTVSTSGAIVQADNLKIIYFTSATPINFTIDALTAKTRVGMLNKGAGTVTFVNGSGVTYSGASSITTGQAATILYSASTTPDIITGSSGSGSVTSVTSANADITVATTTTTPVLTMVQAPALRSATTTINVSSATAPTNGQVLTATSGTAATWQTPSGGSGLTVGTSTITSGTSGNFLYNNAGVLGERTPGTGVATWFQTPSWTNFNAAITGTAPYWSAASGATLIGANTITANTSNYLTHTGTWTASGTGAFGSRFTGSFTGSSTNGHSTIGMLIDPTITQGSGSGQSMIGVQINPSITNINGTAAPLLVGSLASGLYIYSTKISTPSSTLTLAVSDTPRLVIGGNGQVAMGTSLVYTGTGLHVSGNFSDVNGNTGNLYVSGDIGDAAANASKDFYGSIIAGTVLNNWSNTSTFTGQYTGYTWAPSGSSSVFKVHDAHPIINATGGTTTVVGYDYTPTQTSMTGVTEYAFRATSGRVQFNGPLMPNGSAGTSGYVLTSQGSSSAPIWSPAGGGGWATSGTTTLTGAVLISSGDAVTMVTSDDVNIGADNLNVTASSVDLAAPNATVSYSGTGSFKINGLIDNVVLAGTSLTLDDDDHRGKVIYCTSGSAVTITVPSGLPLGFTCTIIQDGGGTVSLSASGSTLHGKVATTAQYDAITIDHYKSSNTYIGF